MRDGKRTAVIVAAGVLGVAGAISFGGVSNADRSDPLQCDFDGDGAADLAVGVSREDNEATSDSGAVNVIYGGVGGLSADDNIIISQGSPGVRGLVEQWDRFGQTVQCGDVDNDGYAELIVASPGEDYASKTSAGTIHVFPGSATGLDLAASTTINRGTPDVPGGPRRSELWGSDIAIGDINGDDYDDLVVASLHLEDAYVYIPGSATGLDPANSQRITETPEVAADEWELAALADFTGDGFDDLVLAGWAPLNTTGGDFGRRRMLVPGSATGPDWDARSNFYFGSTRRYVITATDIDDDDDADLVGFDNGYLIVATGTPTGLDDAVAYLALPPFVDVSWIDDMTAADLDGDGRDEIVIGSDQYDVGDETNAGAVFVVPATPTGHDAGAIQVWHQDTGTIVGTAQAWDGFGTAVHSGDFDGDDNADLAIGAPFEGLGAGRGDAGSVNVVYGSATGLTDVGNQMWHQGRPGIAGALEANDFFGWHLPD